MDYSENEDKYEEALDILKERFKDHSIVADVKGAGKCVDFLLDYQSNTVFGTYERTRENWTEGDTSTPNEGFKVRPSTELKTLTDKGAITFRGVNCVIYDHGEGKGDREFGLWLQYYFDAGKVLEMEKTGDLRQVAKDPRMF